MFYLCSESFPIYILIGFIVFIAINSWRRFSKYTKLVEKDRVIKMMHKPYHLDFRIIFARSYIKDKELRQLHVLYSIEFWLYVFFSQ